MRGDRLPAVWQIRNFSIIAHVDHGKSTLADRILDLTTGTDIRDKREQRLDTLDLERERGITIKASPVRLGYRARDGREYIFHLIDTPGHVDFNYEVNRSLAACEGVLLVIDASQGVEAQTIVNAYLAIDHNLVIIPVINKIDLPNANPEQVRKELEDILGIPGDEALLVSARTGQGVPEVLEAIVQRIPAPAGRIDARLRALIFDSFYDSYQGVIPFICVKEGEVRPGQIIQAMSSGRTFQVTQVGYFDPGLQKGEKLSAGEVGWLTAGIKTIGEVPVGDTLTRSDAPASTPLLGYRPAKPVIFAGLYPVEPEEYEALKEALEKLQLNDAALSFEPETSQALNFGFRCGFLGLLHAEIVQERLEREFNLNLIATAPAVVYQVNLTSGQTITIDNPAKLPEPEAIASIEEPYIKLSLITPQEYVGNVMQLTQERRGMLKTMNYLGRRVELVYEVPFGEVLFDFHDRLKSLSRGYASMDYEQIGYREGKLQKVEVLVNEELVDALSFIIHVDKAYPLARRLVDKLAEVIPRQQFAVPVQAKTGGRIIARSTVKAFRKDVLAKCYGGDVTRKRKLLEKQKEGKKRMKSIGYVEVPQEAFLAVLSLGEEQ
ncbi:MAG: elongation factor 4 [Deinococcus sp.]|nr:elongation factor 4 [Deinococcus sp.]